MAGYSKELLKGAADTLVLSAFAEGEKYGYQVVKELERRSEGFFVFKEGTLYPILHRLERLLSGWQPGEAEEEAVGRLGDTDDIAQAFGEVYRPSRRTQLGLAVALATGMILGVYGIGGGLASATVARKHQSHMVQARTH